MTQITDISGGSARTSDTRIISLVCSAHFVSHFYILLLPPLFPFIREFYGVSYTELGFALTAFNVTTALCQTPAGFLADRIGPRPVLVSGLVLGAAAFATVGLVPSFWLMVAMFAVAGVANAVYHPADYAILSQLVSNERAGQAFSMHIFAGFLGTAVAPATLLIAQGWLGWQGALVAASVMGLVIAALFLAQPAALFEIPPKAARKLDEAPANAAGWKLLLSAPILLNLLFFVMITFSTTGVQNYAVVALGEAYGTPLTAANTALTANLLLSAFGVLIGGVLAARTRQHQWVAVGSFTGIAITGVIIGSFDLGLALLIAVMSLNGFVNGLMQPSRDMIVRAVTPDGQFGKVFGFVTTGFNIGGIIAPLLFGYVMDAGHPRAVFFLVAVLSLLAILTIVPNFLRRSKTIRA
jgi:FSR family fosmidomycin resistance protein-like MFS transporter